MKKKTALVLQHASTEGPGIFKGVLEGYGWGINIQKLYSGDGLPKSTDSYDLVLIMGGPMNVDETDSYPFLVAEVQLIKERIEKDLPTMGICLGSQLIAKAAGAKVYPGPMKEIGWFNVDLTDEGKTDPNLTGFDPVFSAFQWHGDTFDLPSGAARLVTSYPYKNQGFRLGKSIYAFQFHFEVTLDMIKEWIDDCRNDPSIYGEIIRQNVLERSSFHLPPAHSMARRFLISFLHNIG